MFDPIFKKGIIYRAQMADIREAVLRFIHPKGSETQNRGRRADPVVVLTHTGRRSQA